MSHGEARAVEDVGLEKDRARYGLLAVVISNLAIAGVAIFGVWRLDGDKSVIVGVLTAAFTAVSSMTTAYLGIKAVSNTARSIALGNVGGGRQQAAPDATPPAAPPAAPPAQGTP
jgi:Flp pilus assembly pilin Flp